VTGQGSSSGATDPGAGHLGSAHPGASRPDAAGRRTVRIGITGPIGCGKSTVAGWLGELGAAVIDADRVSRDVTAPGSPALRRIAERFGDALVRADGSLDRAALGRIVFADAEALAAIEAIVHPAVRPVILAEMRAAADAGAPAVAVEAIKLVEGGLADLCDEIWLVTCSPSSQLERIASRAAARPPAASDATDAAARVAAQSDLVERLTPAATRVVDTSGTLEETRSLVELAYADALERAGR
jgi:dephospho-CoA kinase